MKQHYFPFAAVVGQDRFKLALILVSIDPTIGGVLAIGDKGTGKTTLIRSLADLLSQEEAVPFVNLPIGASEDRVLGSIELSTLINEKKEVVNAGLLAQADGGILYVDEINLLNDYLMDSLLDASASGSYYLEREGISKRLNSRFSLIGSMNPEEGDLRPQLKDRFGLSVQITTPNDLELRMQVIRNRMDFDCDPQEFSERYTVEQSALITRIRESKSKLNSLMVSEAMIQLCAQLALDHGVEGLRSDILLLKTAKAYAVWNRDNELQRHHIEAIAALVLEHRKRQDPPKSNSNPPSDNPSEKEPPHQEENPTRLDAEQPQNSLKITAKDGKQRKGMESVGKQATVPLAEERGLDVRKTVGQYLAKNHFEPIQKHEEKRAAIHLAFLLDASGSMRKEGVIAYAKGFIEKAVTEHEGKRMIFSLIAMQANEAKTQVDRSSNAGEIIAGLEHVEVGGKTNAIAAFKLLKSLTTDRNKVQHQLVFLTDGKFGDASDAAIQSAISSYQLYGKGVDKATIVDMEKGAVNLGIAQQFARKIKADYERIETKS